MKRIAVSLLLVVLSIAESLPAQTENAATTAENMRRSERAAKQQQKVLKKLTKKQQKTMKKYEKAQRKAAKKANRRAR